MSEAPERIWACMDGPMVGLFVSGGYNAGWPEYVRADLYAKLEADLAAANARADALREAAELDADLLFDAYKAVIAPHRRQTASAATPFKAHDAIRVATSKTLNW